MNTERIKEMESVLGEMYECFSRLIRLEDNFQSGKIDLFRLEMLTGFTVQKIRGLEYRYAMLLSAS